MLDLLRLGCHQLLSMRVPTHAAVAATVDLAAATVGERVTGLVNAVLRKVAARSWDEWTDDLSVGLDAVDALALRSAHPRWIVEAYADLLPDEEVEGALHANNDSAPVSLVRATRSGDGRRAARRRRRAGPLEPVRSALVGEPGRADRRPRGTAGVQDEGSQLAAWGLTRIERRPPTAGGGWTCAPGRAARPRC